MKRLKSHWIAIIFFAVYLALTIWNADYVNWPALWVWLGILGVGSIVYLLARSRKWIAQKIMHNSKFFRLLMAFLVFKVLVIFVTYLAYKADPLSIQIDSEIINGQEGWIKKNRQLELADITLEREQASLSKELLSGLIDTLSKCSDSVKINFFHGESLIRIGDNIVTKQYLDRLPNTSPAFGLQWYSSSKSKKLLELTIVLNNDYERSLSSRLDQITDDLVKSDDRITIIKKMDRSMTFFPFAYLFLIKEIRPMSSFVQIFVLFTGGIDFIFLTAFGFILSETVIPSIRPKQNP